LASPAKLAREANIFETEMSYVGIIKAICDNDPRTFVGTIEFFPEEGKYHVDGHRNCGVRLTPKETIMHDGRCPKCGRKITVGVCARVETMADRQEDEIPQGRVPFESLIPLQEIVSECVQVGVNSKKVTTEYFRLLAELGPDLHILRAAPLHDIHATGGPVLAEAIRRVRTRAVHIDPGYDGEYGTIKIFNDGEREKIIDDGQMSLF